MRPAAGYRSFGDLHFATRSRSPRSTAHGASTQGFRGIAERYEEVHEVDADARPCSASDAVGSRCDLRRTTDTQLRRTLLSRVVEWRRRTSSGCSRKPRCGSVAAEWATLLRLSSDAGTQLNPTLDPPTGCCDVTRGGDSYGSCEHRQTPVPPLNAASVTTPPAALSDPPRRSIRQAVPCSLREYDNA